MADRGETERRGDLDLGGGGDRGAAGGGDRVRLRPREAVLEDMPEEKDRRRREVDNTQRRIVGRFVCESHT